MNIQKISSEINIINNKLEQIQTRNNRVELDKAWETSFVRKLSIAIFTYVTIGLFMNAIKIDRPWLNAIVPSLGFILSTLSLPVIKKIWLDKNIKNK